MKKMKKKKCNICGIDFEPFDEKRSTTCNDEECRRQNRKKLLRGLKPRKEL